MAVQKKLRLSESKASSASGSCTSKSADPTDDGCSSSPASSPQSRPLDSVTTLSAALATGVSPRAFHIPVADYPALLRLRDRFPHRRLDLAPNSHDVRCTYTIARGKHEGSLASFGGVVQLILRRANLWKRPGGLEDLAATDYPVPMEDIWAVYGPYARQTNILQPDNQYLAYDEPTSACFGILEVHNTESRPDARKKEAVYKKQKSINFIVSVYPSFSQDDIALDIEQHYRTATDDWECVSQTVSSAAGSSFYLDARLLAFLPNPPTQGAPELTVGPEELEAEIYHACRRALARDEGDVGAAPTTMLETMASIVASEV
ncbi:hypothetical protein JCM10207_008003 [Rhodosporidiobolus poonsookiae]